jgi:lycopene beta-cyclase
LWADEAAECGVADELARTWKGAVVRTSSGEIALGRGYAQIANDALRARFVATIERAGGSIERGTLGDAAQAATIVFDATGGSSAAPRRDARPPGFQAAWGRVIETKGFDPASAVFMDWSFVARDDDPRPSFLYALPLDERRVFVEETSLVAAPAMPVSTLAARLDARLDARGTPWRYANEETERCLFAMGVAPARRDAWPAPFGASAGYVHPATGYSVMRSLRLAERVADAVVAALAAPGPAPSQGRELVADALWTSDELSAWQLYRYGMSALARFDHADLSAFFAAFFSLPCALRDGFVSGTLTAGDVRRVMWGVFARVPNSLRLKLASGAFGGDFGLLLDGLRG